MDERARTQIEAAVQQAVASGAETGLQVTVVKNGQVIVDAAAECRRAAVLRSGWSG